MKIFYLSIPVLLLFLIGCSATYRVSNFSSKDKFYENFNKSANGKTLKLTLNNDSTFISRNNVIKDDTLYSVKTEIDVINKKIALLEMKELKHSVNNFRAGTILLNDGKTIEANNITIENDTANFSLINTITSFNLSLPISRVKEISYMNHWASVPFGAVPGAVCGFIAGIVAYRINPPTNTWSGNSVYFYSGPVLGLIVGGVWGWLNGWTYTYQFNP
jgi:hypothetical protein